MEFSSSKKLKIVSKVTDANGWLKITYEDGSTAEFAPGKGPNKETKKNK